MNEATKQSILSGVRSILIAVGGILATKGVIDEAQWSIIVGALMTIIPAVWGIYEHIQSERKTAARELIAVNVGILKADATLGITPLETKESAPNTIEMISPAVPTVKDLK